MNSLIPDPDRADAYLIGSASEASYGAQIGVAVLTNVHRPDKCAGRACVVHNPSDHNMRDWALNWRDDRGMMERICPEHGVGHPDPDDLSWHMSEGRNYMGRHGCCRCCTTK